MSTGQSAIVEAGDEYNRHWENSASKSLQSYTSVVPPGSEIEKPDKAYHWHLDGVRHIRAEKIIRDQEDTVRWIAP